jgi:hypothetical protein
MKDHKDPQDQNKIKYNIKILSRSVQWLQVTDLERISIVKSEYFYFWSGLSGLKPFKD